MSSFQKNLLPATALSLVLGPCLLSASDEARMRNLENRVCAIETRENCCCTINPPARPYNPDCWGLYVNVDALIWQGHIDGYDPVIQTSNSTQLQNNLGVDGTSRVKNLSFDWDWGVRLGLGFNSTHDAWDFLLQWTYWDSSASTSVTPGEGEALYPVLNHPFINVNGAYFGSSKTNLDYTLNMLDLENAREFYVSRCLTLRPFGGLRTAWFKQELDVKNTGLAPSGLENNGATQVNLDATVRYWGIGIRAGLDMQWNWGCGFSFFTNAAHSLLYNYYSTKTKEQSVDASGNKVTILDVAGFFHTGSSITDLQTGIRWDWMACDDNYHLGLDIGWEHHMFPGQNRFLNFVDDGSEGKFVYQNGNFATQGYFIKVRFDF